MSADDLLGHAHRFLTTAATHPECRGGRVLAADNEGATVELVINVEMPLHLRVDGVSPNGVRTTETVTARLRPSYPWAVPSFYLRNDFPRELPHLQPGSADDLPRPCLVDADQREFFFQFSLVELGVFNLIHQLVLWLQRAAIGALILPEQGWEPTLRHSLDDVVIINAEACRALVDRNGGYRVLRARYLRSGLVQARVGGRASAFLDVSEDQIPLSRSDKDLFRGKWRENSSIGSTVCCVVWPDKLPSGKAFVTNSYMPETVTTFGELIARASALGCKRALCVFFDALERCLKSVAIEVPIPVAVVLCARRPFHLIGSASDIELLPYVLEIRAGKGASLVTGRDGESVVPAMQRDSTNPELLRTVSGAPEIPPVAILGCGSVGSKMAMHLARSGMQIPVVSDRSVLFPHNMGRHALARPPLAFGKAEELAKELGHLGQSAQVHTADLVVDLAARETRKILFPRGTGFAVNTTASLAVREALSALTSKHIKPRFAELALFGRGHGGLLLFEGEGHNPTLCDLIGELYATVASDRLRTLLVDPDYGLTEIQVGQGCSSLTMPMTDMRLSSMTAALTEEFVVAAQRATHDGEIAFLATTEPALDTLWSRQTVPSFTIVELEGPQGWTIRLSQRILARIREDIARHPGVETGGAMIGMCSARLRTVTVVDLVDAPLVSVRSATRFILGTEGLKDAILSRHVASGKTLFDVGTWHSHLEDSGPSAVDWKTAADLAAERPPPSALLIATPRQYFGLMQPPRER